MLNYKRYYLCPNSYDYLALNYKRYYLRPNSYDYLALNKFLRTYDAIYEYLREIEKDGRRYIIASRLRYGSDTVEDVIVGVRV